MQNPAFSGFACTYFNFLKFLFFIYIFVFIFSKCKVAWNFTSISNWSELIVSYNIREETWIKWKKSWSQKTAKPMQIFFWEKVLQRLYFILCYKFRLNKISMSRNINIIFLILLLISNFIAVSFYTDKSFTPNT